MLNIAPALAASLIALAILTFSPTARAGCGPDNPNCVVQTAPHGTSNSQAASTAFVQQEISQAAGGSNGQIQYNNNGAFGGFTASGDITITTSTGVVTIQSNAITSGKIAASAVTNAKIAAGAADTLKGSTNGSATTDIALVNCASALTYSISTHAFGCGAAGGGIVIGSSTIASGTSGRILYDNAGVVGEYASVPVALGGTGGTSASGTLLDNITGFSSTGYLSRAGAGSYTFAAPASSAQYLAGTATGVPVEPSVIYPSETTTSYGTTTTFDFSTFINTAVTLTGNITTQMLSNVKAGKSGTITFIQDGTGSRTTMWNSIFKWAGGSTPTLSTTASAVDVLAYSCRSATFCAASLMKDVK